MAADQTSLKRLLKRRARVLSSLLSRGRIIIIITRVCGEKVAVKTRFLERFLMLTFPIDRPWVMHRLLYLCAPTTRGLKVGRCSYEFVRTSSRLAYPRSNLSTKESHRANALWDFFISPSPLCLSLFLRKKETKFSHEWINRVTIMADLSSRPIKLPDPRFSNVASHRAFRCSRRNCERRPFRVISQSWCVPLQLGNVCATQRSNGAARVT